MNNKKKITIILGTARVGRHSEKVAQFVLEYAKTRVDMEPTFVDVRDYPQTHTEGLPEEKVKEWQKIAAESDGFIIVSPEYNHGYPGELKMFLDNTQEAQFRSKPFGICGVSSGPIGGARMTEQIKLVINNLYGILIRNATHFTNVETLFDAEGKINDKEVWIKRLVPVFDELARYL